MSMVNTIKTSTKPIFAEGLRTDPNAAIGKDRLRIIIEDMHNADLKTLLAMLAEVANADADYLNPSDLGVFYLNVESKIAAQIKNITPIEACQISFHLASENRGSEELWDLLSQKVQSAVSSGGIPLEDLADFFYALTFRAPLTEESWASIEQSLLDNIDNASSEAIARLFFVYTNSAVAKRMHNYDPNSNDENKTDFINSINQEDALKVFLTVLSERLPNLSIGGVITIGEGLNRIQHYNVAIWERLEERLKELIPRATPESISRAVAVFGTGEQGSRAFWDNMEEYFIEAGSVLSPYALTNFISGFGNKKTGGNYFWDRAERFCLAKSHYIPSTYASALILGFGNAKSGSTGLWNALEDIALATPGVFDAEDIRNIIVGLSKNERGSDRIWSEIESVMLTKFADISLVEKIGFYMLFDSHGRMTPEISSLLQEAAFIKATMVSNQQEES